MTYATVLAEAVMAADDWVEVIDHYRALWADDAALLLVLDRMAAKFERYPDIRDAARALALDDSALVCTAGKALVTSLETRRRP